MLTGMRGIVMPELRRDVVTGKWVVVATDRARRPTDMVPAKPVERAEPEDCPFCRGNEAMTPKEVYAVRPEDSVPDGPGWRVRVVPNKFPAFETGEPVNDSSPLFERLPSEGVHEVIIHSPHHAVTLGDMPVGDINALVEVYRDRLLANSRDPLVKYVHIILNHGVEAGASLEHPHTQLFGLPLVPPLIMQELEGTWMYREKEGGCVFCDVVDRELALKERVVAVTDEFVVISPYAARFPFEQWILPRSHQPSFGDIDSRNIEEFAVVLRDLMKNLDDRLGNPPINYYLHTAPCDGGEHGYYHWHLECMPRVSTPGAFEWGTGMMINIVTPEQAAEFLTGGRTPEFRS